MTRDSTIPQKLAVAAILLFSISYLLPAYEEARGYGCFVACWSILWSPDRSDPGGWLYYSGFVFTNILFVVLVVALFVTKKGRQLRWIGSVILLLHVASWSIIAWGDRNSSAIREIKVGYYVWLSAYAVLLAAQLIRVVNEPTTANPATGTVSAPHPEPLPEGRGR